MFDEKQGKKWNQTSSWWVTFSGRDTKVDDSNPLFSWPHWDQQMQIAAYPLMMLVDILEFWFVLSLCHGPGFWIHSFQLQTLKSCLYLTFWFSVSLFINLWAFVSVFGCFQQVQLLFCSVLLFPYSSVCPVCQFCIFESFVSNSYFLFYFDSCLSLCFILCSTSLVSSSLICSRSTCFLLPLYLLCLLSQFPIIPCWACASWCFLSLSSNSIIP